jgi:hypothetical protein
MENQTPNQDTQNKQVQVQIDPTAATLGLLQHNQAMLRTILQIQIQILAKLDGKDKPEHAKEYESMVNTILNQQGQHAAQDLLRFRVPEKKQG